MEYVPDDPQQCSDPCARIGDMERVRYFCEIHWSYARKTHALFQKQRLFSRLQTRNMNMKGMEYNPRYQMEVANNKTRLKDLDRAYKRKLDKNKRLQKMRMKKMRKK